MSSNAFVPGDPEVPAEPDQLIAGLEALQVEFQGLREEVQANSPADPAEVPAAPTVEDLLESESFKELLRKSNVETLERVIAQAPRLDEGMRKSLILTLERMGQESESGDPSPTEGERCMELRSRIRTLEEEIEDLDGTRPAFTVKGDKKRSEDRKLIVLLEAELEETEKELSEILSTVEDPGPALDDEAKWSQ